MTHIPSPKPNETHAETLARQAAEYPHNHVAGLGEPFINRGVPQDATEAPCNECGRRTAGHAFAHDINCSLYEPHPDSIAGQPGYRAP